METAEANLARVRRDFNTAVSLDRIANRATWEKLIDLGPQWSRFSVLTSGNVFAKLTNAAILRMVFTPVQEIIGTGLKQLPVVEQIAERAPREGYGFMWEAEKATITRAFTHGIKGSVDVLLHHQSDLDVELGRPNFEAGTGEWAKAARVAGVPGRTHGFVKEPVKQSEFGRAEVQRGRWLERQGMSADPTGKPMREQRQLAYDQDALRSIFLQNGAVTDFINSAIRNAEQRNAEGRIKSPIKKIGAATFQTFVPINKVPTNVIAESLGEYIFGLPLGIYKSGEVLYKGRKEMINEGAVKRSVADMAKRGASHLTQNEADAVMRMLKKGSLGAAMVAIGYYNANRIGGFWQSGEVRHREDVPSNNVRPPFKVPLISDPKGNISDTAIHHPLVISMLFGTTIRRVQDAIDHATHKPNGKIYGIYQALKSIIQEVPTLNEMIGMSKELEAPAGKSAASKWLADRMVPTAVRQIAERMDRDAQGKTIKRNPKTFLQNLQNDIPVIRERLPKKPPSDMRYPNVPIPK